MTLLIWTGIFIGALIVLVKGAGIFVDSAKKIGATAGLSPFVIGVLIVGFGTSLPEFAASVAALLQGTTEIVIANAVGSNITNILLIVGFVGVLSGHLVLGKNLIRSELPIFAVATIHFIAIVYDGVVDRIEGVLLVATFLVYLAYLLLTKAHDQKETPERPPFSWPSVMLGLVGLVAVLVGAKYTIDAVIAIGGMLSVPVAVISFTAVALGTSLPELFVSILAVRRGNAALAIGNIFGSNAFNLLMVVGIPALIMPLSLGGAAGTFGVSILAAASVLLFVNALAGRIVRWEGFMFLLFYIFFIVKMFGFSA
jgi:cation:H+ antiporter